MKGHFNNCNTVHYQGTNVSYDFPRCAKYNPPESAILTAMDFVRGEIVEFESFSEKPSSSGLRCAFYRSTSRPEFINLVNISDLMIIEDATGYFSPEEQAEYERILDNQYKDMGININELI